MLSSSFLSHFDTLEDPRLITHPNKRHALMDILVLVLLGTICGADSWVEICAFGASKHAWLKTFLSLPHGIPSHDTLGRVFSLIDPHHFERCFRSWISTLQVDLDRQVIALDGKTLRGSGNKRQGEKALHLVSAWACAQRMMLGQVACLDKSNEIEAIPRLLKMLDIEGSIVTIDALGCQSKITQQILDQRAEYVLSLKDNQGTLSQDVQSIFALGEQQQFKKMLNRRMVEKVRDHGRHETRRYTLISARDPLMFQVRWPGLVSIGLLEVTRTTNHQVERTRRYFLTSLNYEDIDMFKQAVRQHWSIEINLHWSLDVSFREDHNRTRIAHAPRNLATIRRLALQLLTQEKSHKKGIACKRKTAGWDHAYLLKVLKGEQSEEENDQKKLINESEKMKTL